MRSFFLTLAEKGLPKQSYWVNLFHVSLVGRCTGDLIIALKTWKNQIFMICHLLITASLNGFGTWPKDNEELIILRSGSSATGDNSFSNLVGSGSNRHVVGLDAVISLFSSSRPIVVKHCSFSLGAINEAEILDAVEPTFVIVFLMLSNLSVGGGVFFSPIKKKHNLGVRFEPFPLLEFLSTAGKLLRYLRGSYLLPDRNPSF